MRKLLLIPAFLILAVTVFSVRNQVCAGESQCNSEQQCRDGYYFDEDEEECVEKQRVCLDENALNFYDQDFNEDTQVEDEEVCEYEKETPTPDPTATPTPEPQACGRHCVQDSDCRNLDPNYICYTKLQVCRQEHNSEDEQCHPRDFGPSPTPEPTFTPFPGEQEVRGPQK